MIQVVEHDKRSLDRRLTYLAILILQTIIDEPCKYLEFEGNYTKKRSPLSRLDTLTDKVLIRILRC